MRISRLILLLLLPPMCVVAQVPQGTAMRSTNGWGIHTTLYNSASNHYYTNSAEGFAIDTTPKVNFNLSLDAGLYVEPNVAGASIDAQAGGIFGGSLQVLSSGTINVADNWRMGGEGGTKSVIFDTSNSESITNIASGIFNPTNINLGFVGGNPPTLVLQNRTNGPANFIVSGSLYANNLVITNVSGSSFGYYTSITAMASSALTNLPAMVQSYWGTNNAYGDAVGGGNFLWEPGTATTNLGTIFPSAYGGRWRRVVDSASVFELAWFGVWPITSAATIHSSRREFTNLLSIVPEPATIIIPAFLTAYDTPEGTVAISISNRTGLTIRGANEGYGIPLSVGYKAPVLAYIGATNGTLIQIHNSQFIMLDGIGLRSDTPFGTITNTALVCVEMDQSSPHTYITTGNTIQNCRFQSTSDVNPDWIGIYLARTSLDNCENMRFLNNQFQGGGNADAALNGIAIRIGGSANILDVEISDNSFSRIKNCVYAQNGKVNIRRGLATESVCTFKMEGWNDSITIEDFRDEHSQRFLQLGVEGGGGGGLGPVMVQRNYIATDSASSLTNATIYIGTSCRLLMLNNGWGPDTSAVVRHYEVEPGFSPILTSINNRHASALITNDWSQFNNGTAISESGGDIGQLHVWDGAGAILTSKDRYGLTNVGILTMINASAGQHILQLQPTDGTVQVGISNKSSLTVSNINGFNSTALILNASAGNVGIGTSLPRNKLQIGDVSGTAGSRRVLEFGVGGYGSPVAPNATSNGDKILLWNDGAQKTGMGFGNANELWFQSSSGTATDRAFSFYSGPGTAGTPTEKVSILNNGNVGIGTATMAAKLDVVGIVKAGGTNSTVPAFKSAGTNNMILMCPDGGSWILRVDDAGVITTVTNTAAL